MCSHLLSYTLTVETAFIDIRGGRPDIHINCISTTVRKYKLVSGGGYKNRVLWMVRD